jgi:NTE family protein
MNTISSVSGGSIANGLLASMWSEMQLDSTTGVFTNFSDYEGKLRAVCGTNLRTQPLLLERLDPRNWVELWDKDHSATDFLVREYKNRLVGNLQLKDLATAGRPTFVFDACNLQTGVNFELGAVRVGDYQIGHAPIDQVPTLLAEAVAASSSFPFAFPPLVLDFDPNKFQGGDLAKDPPHPQLRAMQQRVLLSDGGVYDNLGLEPVWKSHELVICSDGGEPFSIAADTKTWMVPRLWRSYQIVGNQALAVRKRWLIASFYNDQGAVPKNMYRGTYWGIGGEIEEYPKHQPGYGGLVLERLRQVRTDLDAFNEGEQLVLMNHGWLLADAGIRSWLTNSGVLPDPLPPGTVASTALLDPKAAADALADSHRIEPLGRN